ncbi:fungal chitosanase of glycosyl hydrolase group 75-domain-containing protein [Mycena epipterygia]|nr:fungal chitosanase of glycosyl hydrolase group 75-domain-containing protein [Mycena epipterygia]
MLSKFQQPRNSFHELLTTHSRNLTSIMTFMRPFYFSPLVFAFSRAFPFPMAIDPSTGVTTADKQAFAADPSIDVAGIYSAVQSATQDPLATYATSPAKDHMSTIYGDWLGLDGVQPLHFLADMDIDCDGVSGATTSEPDTTYGALDTTLVPWFVIPDEFQSQQLQPNALGAIICNGKMFYAIFGDTNGDGVPKDSQVIGEGSLLLGQACFPDDGIAGDNGHAAPDVAYIVFGTQVPSGVGQSTIDIAALKTLGDQQTTLLQSALGLGGNAAAAPAAAVNAPKPDLVPENSSENTTSSDS